jgi:hypothetical protein
MKFAEKLAREKGVPLRQDIEEACKDAKLLESIQSIRASNAAWAAPHEAVDAGLPHQELFSSDLRERARREGITLPDSVTSKKDIKDFFQSLLA